MTSSPHYRPVKAMKHLCECDNKEAMYTNYFWCTDFIFIYFHIFYIFIYFYIFAMHDTIQAGWVYCHTVIFATPRDLQNSLNKPTDFYFHIWCSYSMHMILHTAFCLRHCWQMVVKMLSVGWYPPCWTEWGFCSLYRTTSKKSGSKWLHIYT